MNQEEGANPRGPVGVGEERKVKGEGRSVNLKKSKVERCNPFFVSLRALGLRSSGLWPLRGQSFVLCLFFSPCLSVLSVVKWSVSVIKICVYQCSSVAPALHSYDSFLIRAIRDSGFVFPVSGFSPCPPW